MDQSDLYFASAYSLSPSVRTSTSRYVQRLTNSVSLAEQSSLNSSYITVNESVQKEADTTLTQIETEPCSVLFKQFLEARRKYCLPEETFDLLQAYEETCSDHLSVTLSMLQKKSGSETKRETIHPNAGQRLRCERNTWRLIRALYSDRLTKGDNGDEAMSIDENRKSDKQVIELLYEKDSRLREMQLVIDCIEQNESDDIDEESNFKLEFYSEGPHYWENTLCSIKNQLKLQQRKVGERSLCAEMDPDAPVRTGKPLHDVDKEDEDRLMRHMFRYLRAGRLDEVRSSAQKLGYHWLVAALYGWLLHHDPNVGNNVDDVSCIEGNANRDIWKLACWACTAAPSDTQSIYERAIFGVLSGNLKAFLPLCNRWADKLWAYLRVAVDVHIEHELRETEFMKPVTARTSGVINSNTRSSTNLPDEYWNNLTTFAEILRELDSECFQGISDEDKCYQQIDKYVVLNDVSAILETMTNYTQSQLYYNESYWHMLRFFAHVVLFLKASNFLQTESSHQTYISILQSYISHLIECKEIELVAEYVACLPRTNQIESYAQLLQQVKEPEARKLCLKLAKKVDLDVESITKAVVETVRNDRNSAIQPSESYAVEPTSFAHLSGQATEEDRVKIDSLQWLSLNGVQYTELLLQGNSLMRYFELRGKIDAASETFYRLPVDVIEGVFKSWKQATGSTELPLQISDATKEFLCHKAYFQACESFNEWLRFYCNSKPVEPPKPTSARFTDKVAYEHLKKQYDVELEQWKILLAKQAKLTAEKIYNVLMFPDGLWIPRSRASQDGEDSVVEELKLLRKKVIPQLTFILHSLLHSSNHLRECLQIADLVASEHHSLYKEFTPEQMKSLLRNLRQTSIAALNESLDALGYPIMNEPNV